MNKKGKKNKLENLVGPFCELDTSSTMSVHGYFSSCSVKHKEAKKAMEYLENLSAGKFRLALVNQWSKKKKTNGKTQDGILKTQGHKFLSIYCWVLETNEHERKSG